MREAGYKASFFGTRKIVGATDYLPASAQLSGLSMDIPKAAPDAVLVWGRSDDTRYTGLIDSLKLQYPHNSIETIIDPALGEVGVVLFIAR